MLKGFKYRIYPTEEQSVLIDKHIGCTRLVYNLGLEAKKLAYLGAKTNLSYFDLNTQLNELKKEYGWMKEVNAQSMQASLHNLDESFTKFFRKQNDFPQFKKKSGRQSFSCPQHTSIDWVENKLYAIKFKEGIAIELHKPFKGKIKNTTISKTASGKYFASVLVESNEVIPAKPVPTKERAIGIDVGLISMAVIADRNLENISTIENPKWMQNIQHLIKRRQKQLSRKLKGSKNREKAKLKLARLHERIARQRLDFTHKLTYKLTHDSQVDTICIEDLNIKGMVKNHKLAGAISAVAWGEMFRQLEYKSDWNGKNILQAHRFSATSKTCGCCKNINNNLTLKDRTWICPTCNSVNDRDENAIPNIIDSAFDEYIKTNRDGLPELTPAETQPLSKRKRLGKQGQRNRKSLEDISYLIKAA